MLQIRNKVLSSRFLRRLLDSLALLDELDQSVAFAFRGRLNAVTHTSPTLIRNAVARAIPAWRKALNVVFPKDARGAGFCGRLLGVCRPGSGRGLAGHPAMDAAPVPSGVANKPLDGKLLRDARARL
jgi:hypothetical protein